MKRILLVDDDPMVLAVLRVALEDRGFIAEVAHNGRQALRAAAAFEPHAVITDVDMPRMGGRELCSELRNRYPAETLPIFVVTTNTAVEPDEWSVANLHFLEKPVSVRRLLSGLEQALDSADEVKM